MRRLKKWGTYTERWTGKSKAYYGRDSCAGGCPVTLGDTFRRKPSAFSREEAWGGPVKLTWTVIYINAKHRFYTAEAMCHGVKLRESFKF